MSDVKWSVGVRPCDSHKNVLGHVAPQLKTMTCETRGKKLRVSAAARHLEAETRNRTAQHKKNILSRTERSQSPRRKSWSDSVLSGRTQSAAGRSTYMVREVGI